MLRPYYSFLIVPQTKKALHPQVKGRCPSVQITLDVFCVISLDLISPETSTCFRRTSSTTFILAISAAAYHIYAATYHITSTDGQTADKLHLFDSFLLCSRQIQEFVPIVFNTMLPAFTLPSILCSVLIYAFTLHRSV